MQTCQIVPAEARLVLFVIINLSTFQGHIMPGCKMKGLTLAQLTYHWLYHKTKLVTKVLREPIFESEKKNVLIKDLS